MGGPLSCLVAEVFMDYLENRLFETYNTPQVLEWIRYVDDVLCVWEGSDAQLYEFLDLLNSLEPSITFTLEIGGDSINFLDLTISLHSSPSITLSLSSFLPVSPNPSPPCILPPSSLPSSLSLSSSS